jgi:hypothetical protein
VIKLADRWVMLVLMPILGILMIHLALSQGRLRTQKVYLHFHFSGQLFARGNYFRMILKPLEHVVCDLIKIFKFLGIHPFGWAAITAGRPESTNEARGSVALKYYGSSKVEIEESLETVGNQGSSGFWIFRPHTHNSCRLVSGQRQAVTQRKHAFQECMSEGIRLAEINNGSKNHSVRGRDLFIKGSHVIANNAAVCGSALGTTSTGKNPQLGQVDKLIVLTGILRNFH